MKKKFSHRQFHKRSFYTNVLHTYLRRRAETFETPGGQAQSLAGKLRPSANLATRSPTYCAAAATPQHSCSHSIHIPPRSPAFASRTAPFCPQLPSSMDLCFPVQQQRRSTCVSLGSESLKEGDECVCDCVSGVDTSGSTEEFAFHFRDPFALCVVSLALREIDG